MLLPATLRRWLVERDEDYRGKHEQQEDAAPGTDGTPEGLPTEQSSQDHNEYEQPNE